MNRKTKRKERNTKPLKDDFGIEIAAGLFAGAVWLSAVYKLLININRLSHQ